jgi:glycosyltransferase involved in cell wall biosynthesis
MEKVIYNIASYKREDTLLKTIDSIYHQCDIINVALNDYKNIPVELYDKKINLFITDNDKGDAYKFYNLVNSDGYYLTIDDDLIYDKNYTQFMINKIEEYNRKSIITIHGRNFQNFPINSYYNRATTVYHFRSSLDSDKVVQFGGTGVMGFHTDLLKVSMDYFQYPNMADVWIGKYSKENNIKIICASHDKDLVKQQSYEESIYSNDLRDDTKQTKLVNDCYTNNEVSIIVPTFNNVEYINECLDSIIKSCEGFNYEILIGIDKCQKTLDYIKLGTYNHNIRFFYFTNNVGPYVIKNTLAELSNSKYLLFFDSDDIMKPEMVEKMLSLQKNCDFVRPMLLNFNQGENPYSVKTTYTNKYGEGVFSISRSLFLSMNGFENWRCSADTDFMTRLFKNSCKFINTPSILFYRRIHGNSLTQTKQTGYGSKVRAEYNKLVSSKTFFGPLPILHTSQFHEVSVGYVKPNRPIEVFDEIKNKKMVVNDVINNILSKTNIDRTTVNYDLISKVSQKKGDYVPTNHVKPVRENKPMDRMKITELKKDSLAYQSREFGDIKRTKKSSSPNIFGGNSKRKGGPLL